MPDIRRDQRKPVREMTTTCEQRERDVAQCEISCVSEMRNEPFRLLAKLSRRSRRQCDQIRPPIVSDALDRRRLFDHDMRIRAAESERTNCGTARRAGVRPEFPSPG